MKIISANTRWPSLVGRHICLPTSIRIIAGCMMLGVIFLSACSQGSDVKDKAPKVSKPAAQISTEQSPTVIVIEAQNTQITSGSRLETNAPIKIREGGFIRVLFQNGAVYKLAGPIDGRGWATDIGNTPGSDQNKLQKIYNAINAQPETATLSIRSGEQIANRDVDIGVLDKRCFVAGMPIYVKTTPPGYFTHLNLQTATETHTIDWPAEQKRTPIPANLLQIGNTEIRFNFMEGAVMTSTNIEIFLANDPDIIVKMIEKGCTWDALWLIRDPGH